MQARLDLAVSKGCDGVEPDNVDSYANSNGLGLTAADQLDFNRFVAAEAHKRGLSVGLKNDLDQVKTLQPAYDWALNEQCSQYGECSSLTPFVTAGKAVFGVEYTGSASYVFPFSIVFYSSSPILHHLLFTHINSRIQQILPIHGYLKVLLDVEGLGSRSQGHSMLHLCLRWLRC